MAESFTLAVPEVVPAVTTAVLEQLTTDGLLAGAITGAPD